MRQYRIVKNFFGSLEIQAFTRAIVEEIFHLPDLVMRDGAEVGSLRKGLSNQTVRIFVRPRGRTERENAEKFEGVSCQMPTTLMAR